MDLGRRGAFFSLFVIMALILVIFTVRLENQFHETDRADLFEERVSQVSFLVQDVQEDLGNALSITGYRALLGSSEFVASRIAAGDPFPYLENASENLSSLIIWGNLSTGTLRQTNASTLLNWSAVIFNISRAVGVNITYTLTNLSVRSWGPWHLNITATGKLFVRDQSGLLTWNITMRKTVMLDFTKGRGIKDPLYYRASNGIASLIHNNTIRPGPWPISLLWSNETIGPNPEDYQVHLDNLSSHIAGQYYLYHDLAPSLLMRLMGKDNCGLADFAEECAGSGIESFVNQFDYSAEGGIPVSPNAPPPCAVDYQFFTFDPAVDCAIGTRTAFDDNFDTLFATFGAHLWLNATHLEHYGLLDLNDTVPPPAPNPQ